MQERRFYLDTSIWRDYFEDRKDNLRPIGLFAFQFLYECKKRNLKVLYSVPVIAELEKRFSIQQINELFSPFVKIIVEIQVFNEQREEAKKLEAKISESHKSDILHAILARDNNAIMVARDKGFESLKEIVEIKKPEDVTFD